MTNNESKTCVAEIQWLPPKTCEYEKQDESQGPEELMTEAPTAAVPTTDATANVDASPIAG